MSQPLRVPHIDFATPTGTPQVVARKGYGLTPLSKENDRGANPPSPDADLTALASLTGTVTERKPQTDLDRDLLHLRLLAEAKAKGIPWAVIGAARGVSGKQAKRDAKALARETQRLLLSGDCDT